MQHFAAAKQFVGAAAVWSSDVIRNKKVGKNYPHMMISIRHDIVNNTFMIGDYESQTGRLLV